MVEGVKKKQKDKKEQENKKDKVMIITNHSYMLWQFRRELIEALMKEYEVVISMPFVGHEDDFRDMGVRCIDTDIERRGINPKTDLKLIGVYYHMLKSEKPDFVITYSIKPNIYAGLMCSMLRIPFYANVQGLGTAFQKKKLAWFVSILYKLSFLKVRKVFFENEVNAQEFQKRHIIPAEKQKVLHGAGINLEYYTYQPYPHNESVHFLFLGRLMKEKGMDELFAAVKKLHREGENFTLDLVGFFEDEYGEEVEKLQKNGIAVFHGFQADPRPFYAAADCIVMPSYHEGMSNVLLEAAAVGRPMITTNIPGCREAVDHKKSGLLVRVKDEKCLYRGMKYFLKLPREKREEMGKAGREKMEREFDKREIVAETMEVLRCE